MTSGRGFEINCSWHYAPPLLQSLAGDLAGVLDDTATHRATGECCEVHLPCGLGRAVAFLCAMGSYGCYCCNHVNHKGNILVGVG